MSGQDLYGEWLALAEEYFNRLPPEIESQIHELLEWNAQFAELAANVEAVKARLAAEREESERIQARIDEISARQCRTVEFELEEKKLRKWQKKMRKLQRQIDEAVGRITRQMEARRREAAAQAEAEAAERARKQAEDLAVWEAYKKQLGEVNNPEDVALDAVEQTLREEAVWQRLQGEIRQIQSRVAPTQDENQRVWEAYVRGEPLPDYEKEAAELAEAERQRQAEINKRIAEAAQSRRIREEVTNIQSQDKPDPKEDAALWAAFTDAIADEKKTKRKKR